MIEEGLVAYLLADANLSALVGNRIHPIELPQTINTPAITYQRISNPRTMTHDQDSTGLSEPRFQFNAYAETYSVARAVIVALRECLLGFKGVFGTIRVDGILHEHEQDFYEPETELYHMIVDYRIMYGE